MAEHYTDPWVYALSGPWTEEMERSQRPCKYCGKPAAMTEPGKDWKAHKVCALNNPSSGPLGYGDDWRDDHHAIEPRPVGCGTPSPGQTSGKACAGTGAEVVCQLCPNSPTYWRNA